MSGYCTYTVYVRQRPEDGGGERAVPCGQARVGVALGPGLSVVLCARHYTVVEKALRKAPDLTVRLSHDQRLAEMAAGGEE